jgi:hypothetical protein
MQYMKLNEVQRHELMAALAGMKTFLRKAFESLTPDEARTPGPGGAFSPVERERNYRALSLAEGLRAFEAAREANLQAHVAEIQQWQRFVGKR